MGDFILGRTWIQKLEAVKFTLALREMDSKAYILEEKKALSDREETIWEVMILICFHHCLAPSFNPKVCH